MNFVFLPATEPGDQNYGSVPEQIDQLPGSTLHTIQFPHLVWYNPDIQEEAIRQIRELNLESIILIGFSKSGLGAWNISRQIPERVTATIIFDSPMSRQTLPTWGTAPFYPDDATWQADSPINSIDHFCRSVKPDHQLVLISSTAFHEEMEDLSTALRDKNFPHSFLSCPHFKHHWNSGWLKKGVAEIGN